MRTDWYKNVNPNLDRLAQILGMTGGNKPSHGYTIAEKAPEVVTAPGVYFPAEKGEVIPLRSRQEGGTVTPSKPSSKDNETRKLDILESIIASIKPAGLESNSLMGLTIPPEPLKIEQSKYDILKSAISILKPPAQQKTSSQGGGSSQTKTPSPKSTPSNAGVGLPVPPTFPTVPTSMEGIPTPQSIQPEIRTDSPEINPMSGNLVNLNREDNLSTQMFPRQGGGKVSPSTLQGDGEVDPADLDLLNSILMRSTKRKLPYNERTSAYGSPSGKSIFSNLPSTPLGVADKGISEGDLLWQKKRAEAGWANPAQDLWEHKREEGMVAGQWSMPMFSRQAGGDVDPLINAEEEARRARLRGLMNLSSPVGEVPPQPVPAPPPTEQVPAGLEGFITNVNRTPTGTVYTGPEGQATVGPERFFLGDKEVPVGTQGAISGETLAKERLSADIKKQESERELMAKGLGYGQDLGYWAAHPEEKAMADFEEMLGRGRYTASQRAELTKQYIASKGLLDVAGLKPGKVPTPHYVPTIQGDVFGNFDVTTGTFTGIRKATKKDVEDVQTGKTKEPKKYQPHSFIKPDGKIGWVEPGKEVPEGWRPYEKAEKPERLSMTDVTARFNGKMRGIKQRMMVDMTPDEQAFVANQPEGNLLALLLSGKIGQKLSPKLKEQYKQEALDAEKEFEELSGGIVGRKGGKLPFETRGVVSPEQEIESETISSRGEVVPQRTFKDKQGKEMVPDPNSNTGWRYR